MFLQRGLSRPEDFFTATDVTDPVASIDKVCATIRDNGLVSVQSSTEYRIFNAISLLSVAGSIIIFFTAMWNPKLAQHPYKLVSTIALIDAAYFMILNTLEEICVLELHKVFAYTVFFSGAPEE